MASKTVKKRGIAEGYQPMKKGYQPSGEAQPANPPQGGSAVSSGSSKQQQREKK